MAIGLQICSGTEWRVLKQIWEVTAPAIYPYGEYWGTSIGGHPCVFFHSRRTKVRAAGACQFGIDKWAVDRLVVLGTCGGVDPSRRVFDIIQATRTLQYDCHDKRPGMGAETMSPAWPALAAISGRCHLGALASADHDMTHADLAPLRALDVMGADWESAAISAVCALNRIPWLILRGISDIPRDPGAADHERQLSDYKKNAPVIMETLLSWVPELVSLLGSG